MQQWALNYLVCPRTGQRLELRDAQGDGSEIIEGTLVSEDGASSYPIEDGIAKLIPDEDYCRSFGLQWNQFSRLRSDCYNGTTLVYDTIQRRTGWTSNHLSGKAVLECGCGSGNDTEALLAFGAERILAFDLSSSVHAARRQVRDPRVCFVQADMMQIPVQPLFFDVVFCHRVIQHTPDPRRAFFSIVQHVKPGGEVLLHSYDKHWLSMLHWKYLLRPLTSWLDDRTLLRCLRFVGPPIYALQSPLLRAMGDNKYAAYVISRLFPFYNYAHIYRRAGSHLSGRELFEVSLLDTFDALAPTYDLPNTAETILSWFEEVGLESVETTMRNPVFIKARAPNPVVTGYHTGHALSAESDRRALPT